MRTVHATFKGRPRRRSAQQRRSSCDILSFMRTLSIALLLVGCVDVKPGTQSPTPTPQDSDTTPLDTSAPVGDSAETAAPDTGDPIEGVDGPSDPVEEELGDMDYAALSDWIFSEDEVHLIDLVVSEDSITALETNAREYAEADLYFDGVLVPSVGIRVKGKYGSFRNFGKKASLKIDFDRYVDDQEFYGLKKLNLNNSVVDCSYMHDRVAYKAFELAGGPYLRTGYAWLTINGEDSGLYVIVEAVDQRLLERTFEDPTGNLYDGKYVMTSGTYVLVDFVDGRDDYFSLQEGTDVGLADIYGITAAASTHHASGMYYVGMDAMVNWDQVLNDWAVQQWIGQNDGYVLNDNNFYVYFNPTDGKLNMIPWDLDYSFLYDYQWGMSWGSPDGVLAAYCAADELCGAAWRAAVERFLATLDEDALVDFAEKISEQSAEYGALDPNATCSVSSQDYYRAYVMSWLSSATATQKAFWGIE